MIVLDLKLPGVNGFELLERVKAHPQWKFSPVLVFSTSEAAADVERAYNLQASGYAVKPSTPAGLRAFMAHLNAYWLPTVSVPRQGV